MNVSQAREWFRRECAWSQRRISSEEHARTSSTRAMVLSLAAALACPGCGSPTLPTPTVTTPTFTGPAAPAPAPFPPGPATSVLAVSKLTIDLSRVGLSLLAYLPRTLALTETSGKSGATVRTIDVTTANGTPDSMCMGIGSIRIGAGQTLDLAPALSYCMPYTLTSSLASVITVTLTFADDDGRLGSLVSSVDVSACTLDSKAGAVLCN